jgi:hypothetical protein
VTAHAPTAPRSRFHLQAEHVVAAVVVTLAVIGFNAAVGGLPQGKPVATTCAWRGSALVVSGGLVNTGGSSAQFRINARIWIAGRRHAVRRVAFVDSLAALSAARWTAPPYRDARKGLVGSTIRSCVAHVRTIPPPSGDD